MTFARWYAFRSIHDWAAEFFEKARAAGGDVPNLELARSYWQLGRNEGAGHEFRRAVDRHAAPADYLSLCLQATAESKDAAEAQESPTDEVPVPSSK
jgi:hypothetical protein